jgi:F-type H+-transporting ATPase subunit gamma
MTYEKAAAFAQDLMNRYVKGEFDRIDIVYNQFKNAAVQRLIVEQYLPVPPAENAGASKTQVDYLFEPDRHRIVSELVPKSLKIRFFKDLLDSFASEMGARMTAMQLATDNASELLKELKLTYNKTRQASITKEILEIVTGAEALKG